MTRERMDRLMILLPDGLLAEIDEYRRACPDIPARTEAIRRLVRGGLAAWLATDPVPAR